MNCEVRTLTGKEISRISWELGDGDIPDLKNWAHALVLFAVNSVRRSIEVELDRDRHTGETQLLIWASDGSSAPGAAFDQEPAKKLSLHALVAALIARDASDLYEFEILPVIAEAFLKASIDLRQAAENKPVAVPPKWPSEAE